MKSKISKIILISIVALLLISAGSYFLISSYYRDSFMINTWINGVYCTGKSVEEINTELLSDVKAPCLQIIGSDGEVNIINLADAEYKEDLMTSLYIQRKSQSPFLWVKQLFHEQHLEMLPTVSWNKDKLNALILNCDLVQKSIREESTIDVYITLDENGYLLYDGMSDVFDAQAFADAVIANLEMGVLSTNINDSKFYYVKEDSPEQRKVRELWTELDCFLNTGLIYDMGAEQVVFNKKITSDFIQVSDNGEFIRDENGNLMFSDEKILQYADELFAKYNTVNTNLTFVTTNGDIVEVPYNKYGTEIDVEKEKTYLLNALHNRISEVHVPTYKQEGYVRGLNDIGDTYIEVDMTLQKMYCYKNGELIVETDIVTGNMRNNWDTPVGVNFVYAKQKKRILRGANYATPVDYWMPVVGNIGLHDANWRNEFGGEIYKTNGSHGCINIPPDIMPTVYEEFEVGTPVIMFY